MLTSFRKGIPFTKMHGAGNDYVYIDALHGAPANLPLLSKLISDRHFGVGSDGLVAIMPSEKADFLMRMFNADGSEAEMCGNASRCIGKYVYDRGLTDKTEITLETLAGIKTLHLHISDKHGSDRGTVEEVSVDMGIPELRPALIPAVSASSESMISEKAEVNGHEYLITAVGMGNPHAVVFADSLPDSLVLGEGPHLECASIFPKKANIEFIRVIDRENVEMRVWERGSGETLACGTGACAATVAGVLNGITGRHLTLRLPGGILKTRWDETSGKIFLRGGAEFIADGTFYIPESFTESVMTGQKTDEKDESQR